MNTARRLNYKSIGVGDGKPDASPLAVGILDRRSCELGRSVASLEIILLIIG